MIIEKAPKEAGSVSDTFIFTILQNGKTIRTFGEPITLIFDVDLTNVSNRNNLKVFYFNEDTGDWEEIGGKYENGKVIVETDHFSKFTVFEVEEEAAPPPSGETDPNDKGQSSDGKTTSQENVIVSTDQQDGSANTLPNTATSSFNLIFIGALLLAVGALLLFIRRKKECEEKTCDY